VRASTRTTIGSSSVIAHSEPESTAIARARGDRTRSATRPVTASIRVSSPPPFSAHTEPESIASWPGAPCGPSERGSGSSTRSRTVRVSGSTRSSRLFATPTSVGPATPDPTHSPPAPATTSVGVAPMPNTSRRFVRASMRAIVC
jgi:hypothetical protein